MGRIYKILPRADWEDARAAGVFDGSAVDHADGFIHFSTAAQAQETARKHFAGQSGLVVLEIEAGDLYEYEEAHMPWVLLGACLLGTAVFSRRIWFEVLP